MTRFRMISVLTLLVASQSLAAPPGLMRPLSRRSVFARNGEQVSSDDGGCDYSLQDTESWFWGDDSVPKVNVTLATENNPTAKLLSSSRFAGCLSAAVPIVTGSTELQLADTTDIAAMQAAWDWINSVPDQYVILVDDQSAGQRSLFNVSAVAFDANRRTVAITATQSSWKEAMGNDYGIEVSSRGLQAGGIARRDTYHGVIIDLATDFSTTLFSEYNTSLLCTPCATTGEIDYVIQYGTWFDNYVELTALNVGISLGLLLDTNVPFFTGLQQTYPLVAVDLPLVIIQDVLTFDLTFGIQGLVDVSSIDAVGKLATATSVVLESSSVRVSLDNAAQSPTYQGWNFTTVVQTPEFEGQLDVATTTGLTWSLGFSLDIVGITSLSLDLDLLAPDVSVKEAIIVATEGGVCGNDSAIAGASFDISGEAQLGFDIKLDEIPILSTSLPPQGASWTTCLAVPTSS